MRLVLLSLLYLCCNGQVFADPVDGIQKLDCDTTVQNQHRLLLQYGRAHLTTIRSGMKYINGNLQDLAQRKQTLKDEAAKARGLAALLQVILSKIEENGANECTISAEKQPIENEITNLKSRLVEMDFTLNILTSHKETSLLQLKQMQTQEKEIEISILHEEQQGTGGPLGNIETYLVAQLERSQETLDFERLCCQHKLEATLKLMDAKLELVESVKNYSNQDLNKEIDNEKKRRTDERIVNIEQQLKDAKTSNEICLAKDAENINKIKNIEEQLKTCETMKADISSENTNLEAELQETSHELDAALRTTTTIARPTTLVPHEGTVTLSTGTYLFNSQTNLEAELQETSHELDAALRTTTTIARPTTLVPHEGTVTLSTGTYLFNSQTMNWNDARNFCHSKRMDLLAIESLEENLVLSRHGTTLNIFKPWNGAWTSGCYNRRRVRFVWQSTGKNLIYKNWWKGYGKPRAVGYCIVFYPPTPQWWVVSNTALQPVICEL